MGNARQIADKEEIDIRIVKPFILMSSHFIILASQRTGSNMLVSVLDGHPEIRCHGELFRRNNVGKKGALKVLKKIDPAYESADYRDLHHVDYINAVRKAEKDNSRFFGFKLMLNQAENAHAGFINNTDYRKILLRRDNLLAVYSSNLIARETGQGNVKAHQEVKPAQVIFKPKGFLRFLGKHTEKYQAERNRLDRGAGNDYLEISYLDICKKSGTEEVFRFIGVDPEMGSGRTDTRKRNTSKILERFSNPETVKSCLADLDHLDWLDERFLSG